MPGKPRPTRGAGRGALLDELTLGVAVLSSGAVCGGLIMVAAAVAPVFAELPVSQWVRLHNAIDRRVDRYMPPLTGLAIVAALLGGARADDPTTRLALCAGAVGDIAVAVVSQFLNVPLNRTVRKWDHTRPPVAATDVRAKWVRSHQLRTVAGTLAAVSTAAALVHDRHRAI